MCDKCEIYERYLKRIAACKHNPDPFGYLPALASEALDEAAKQIVERAAVLPEVAMSNEEIAKELLSVLMKKMLFREALPSEGWAVEKICDALEAAQYRLHMDAKRAAAQKELDELGERLAANHTKLQAALRQ